MTHLGVTVSSCGANLCANHIAERSLSLDGRHVAVVFTRDCGATTGFSNQVTILDSGATLPNASGNVFVAPDSSAVRAVWLAADTLVIQAAVASPVRAESLLNGITIRYLKSVPGLSNQRLELPGATTK